MSSKILKTLPGDVIAIWLIAIVALCAGLVLNQLRDVRLPLVYESKEQRMMAQVRDVAATTPQPRPESRSVAEYVSLDEFKQLVTDKSAIILDARPEIFHRLGHVPGALSFPREDFQAAFGANQMGLKSRNTLIAVYCSSSSCEDSELVKKGLVDLGFSKVAVFKGGWAEWTEAGLQQEQIQ
jgi:rhodanese-related sulfurtransferase